MNKFTTLLATTTAAIALAGPAIAANSDTKTETHIEHKARGGFEKNTSAEKSTPAGAIKAETNVELDVDSDGSREKTTTTERVNDPKGLFNKDTAKTKTTEKVDEDGKRTVESEKTVNGKTVSETKKSW